MVLLEHHTHTCRAHNQVPGPEGKPYIGTLLARAVATLHAQLSRRTLALQSPRWTPHAAAHTGSIPATVLLCERWADPSLAHSAATSIAHVRILPACLTLTRLPAREPPDRPATPIMSLTWKGVRAAVNGCPQEQPPAPLTETPALHPACGLRAQTIHSNPSPPIPTGGLCPHAIPQPPWSPPP